MSRIEYAMGRAWEVEEEDVATEHMIRSAEKSSICSGCKYNGTCDMNICMYN